jgi:hypothetical protein
LFPPSAPLVPILVAAGIAWASALRPAQAVVVVEPSRSIDLEFNCLKGSGAGCPEVTLEKSWTVEAGARAMPNAFTRIHEWTSKSTFTPCDQQNQLWPSGSTVPVSVVETKATQGVVFCLDFGGSIGTRVCSFVTAVTNLNLITSAGTTSVGVIPASGLATGREVKDAVVTELLNGDFTITADAFFNGPSASPPPRSARVTGGSRRRTQSRCPDPCRSWERRRRLAGVGSCGG